MPGVSRQFKTAHQRSDRVRPDESQEPRDQQNDGDGVQHVISPFEVRIHLTTATRTERFPIDAPSMLHPLKRVCTFEHTCKW